MNKLKKDTELFATKNRNDDDQKEHTHMKRKKMASKRNNNAKNGDVQVIESR